MLERVRSEPHGRDKVVCLDPFGFENTFALLMRRDQAERLGIRTISDLRASSRRHPARLRPRVHEPARRLSRAGPGLWPASSTTPRGRWTATCSTRPWPKARSTWPRATRPTAGSPRWTWFSSKTTAATFPPYEAVPLVRAGALERFPQLPDVLNRLAGKIDAPAMRRLNREVDEERKKPEDVAKRFLLSRGLLEPN